MTVKRVEVTNMTYSKPKAAVLGNAVRVINGICKSCGLALDLATGKKDMPPPAYDLDE